MIKIEINNIDEIAKEFVKRIELSIDPNFDFSDGKDFSDSNDELQRRVHELYLCKPDLLQSKNAIFKKDVDNNKWDTNKYFNYEKVIYKTGKDGIQHNYWLMEKLDIRTCPYCNRQYTFTIRGKKTNIIADFDHFHTKKTKSKSDEAYPYLALSFYNLIPSCPTCNHRKRDKKIEKNPYLNGFGDECKFVLKDKNLKKPAAIDKKNIEVDFSSDNDNITIFGLKELYNEHKDYITEIIDKAQAYNSSYYDSLIHSFRGLGKTPAEIDRFVWGNYLETAEHCKRPLSKLTRDILEQIGIK
jgi:5-methylcytosine-specific restriction endonuclease McrA